MDFETWFDMYYDDLHADWLKSKGFPNLRGFAMVMWSRRNEH